MKNKYIIFATIGFELISLILVGIYSGHYLTAQYNWPKSTQAFTIVIAFFIWFVSLIIKLRNMKND